MANIKIFIGGLPAGTKPEELRVLFEAFGVVAECDIMNRCGFVHVQNEAVANAAIEALHDSDFKGQKIVVERGRPRRAPNAAKGSGKRNRRKNSGKVAKPNGNVAKSPGNVAKPTGNVAKPNQRQQPSTQRGPGNKGNAPKNDHMANGSKLFQRRERGNVANAGNRGDFQYNRNTNMRSQIMNSLREQLRPGQSSYGSNAPFNRDAFDAAPNYGRNAGRNLNIWQTGAFAQNDSYDNERSYNGARPMDTYDSFYNSGDNNRLGNTDRRGYTLGRDGMNYNQQNPSMNANSSAFNTGFGSANGGSSYGDRAMEGFTEGGRADIMASLGGRTQSSAIAKALQQLASAVMQENRNDYNQNGGSYMNARSNGFAQDYPQMRTSGGPWGGNRN